MPHFHGHDRLKPFTPGLWEDLKALPWVVKQVLTKGGRTDGGKKPLYASSLAFKTSLALVPAIAILLAIMSNDAFLKQRELLLDQIVDAIYPVEASNPNSVLDPSEPQNLKKLNEFGKQQIRFSVKKFAAHSQRAGVLGFLGFLAVVFLLMRDVENSFNHLWRVPNPRSLGSQWFRHMTFFIGLPLIGIFLMNLTDWVDKFHIFNPGFHRWVFDSLIPFLMLWASLAWLYRWIPNTKVDLRSAIVAGLLAAALLGVARWGMNWYTHMMFRMSNIYGALWMIPVMLIWFYLSWAVILFGVEVSFFNQQRRREASR